MKKAYLFLVLILVTSLLAAQSQKITPKTLDEWTFLGEGSKLVQGQKFFMKEAPESKGVMIISPESYGENVVVRYEVMTLTPATVCVALLSASNIGDDTNLSFPEGYDGAMNYLTKEVEHYFYAFRNAPHDYPPFIRKYPAEKGTDPALVINDKNLMHCGIYYQIEVGREGDKLWLKIDGKKIIKTVDEESLGGGHIGLRIRGTAGEYASCLIKNMEIEIN